MSQFGMIITFLFTVIITALCIFCTVSAVGMWINMIKTKSGFGITFFIGFLVVLLIIASSTLVWIDITNVHKCSKCKSWTFMQTYCTECGNRLEENTLVTCSNCYTDNWYNNKYCSHCGTELNKEEE